MIRKTVAALAAAAATLAVVVVAGPVAGPATALTSPEEVSYGTDITHDM